MNREIVQRVLDRFLPSQLIAPEESFNDLRRRFLPHVIDVLPGGRARWGVLRKSGGSIPSDIVVDQDNIHYDVLSGAKQPGGLWKVTATWGRIGDIKDQNPAWRWMSLEESKIVPIDPVPTEPLPPPPPPPPPPMPPDDTRAFDALVARVTAAEVVIEQQSKVIADLERVQLELQKSLEALEQPIGEMVFEGETDQKWNHKHTFRAIVRPGRA